MITEVITVRLLDYNVMGLTSSDSGLYFRRIKQQFFGRRSHCDLLSSPVQYTFIMTRYFEFASYSPKVLCTRGTFSGEQ